MWVKICGIRDVETACGVASLRPDAIGLNFYARSPRGISVETAARIAAALPDGVQPVGLFVNHTAEEIDAICRTCRLSIIQLHGDEPFEFFADLSRRDATRKIIRAIRLDAHGIAPVSSFLHQCDRAGIAPFAVLVDACVEGAYGGTGRSAPWDLLRAEYRAGQWPPLILAGGLHPGNVADAIRRVQPWGVDVASGVESSPPCKDLSKVAAFIDAARSAAAPATRRSSADTLADERGSPENGRNRQIFPPLPLGEGRGEGEQ